ncbi:GNAT family N-acetyltransferase [Gordonia sp. LSe1-13]|uniref:GNAT family N-acetyltransferase n=1 Tax=Gordonia sesuvii TaxID=3116777 RepID=A0ABU7MHI0_9ACTN|nr:GNAT family N-acetyltransferase [Gordonia sp. LSe1-13]
MAPTITVTSSHDRDLVAAVLAQAFAEDPVTVWLQPDTRHHKLIFGTLLRWVHGDSSSVDVAMRDGVAVGAAVWDPPGHKISAASQIGSMVGFARALRGRMPLGQMLEQEFTKHRPKEPHWYLGQVGAPVRGMGVGTALLEAGLERVDAPAYLESSNEANVPLYERFGFTVTGEITLPRGGPTVWPMYRQG